MRQRFVFSSLTPNFWLIPCKLSKDRQRNWPIYLRILVLYLVHTVFLINEMFYRTELGLLSPNGGDTSWESYNESYPWHSHPLESRWNLWPASKQQNMAKLIECHSCDCATHMAKQRDFQMYLRPRSVCFGLITGKAALGRPDLIDGAL